ncbi:MAG: hypothetical protein VB027_10380 [Gordonibacter sp.]|nr:hypothetical protein [Gordonibacter sp.]
MNAVKAGLYDAADFMDDEVGSDEAMRHARSLVAQAAGIALVCSLAMDSVAEDGGGDALQADCVDWPVSRLMFKCWDDLTVAENLIG